MGSFVFLPPDNMSRSPDPYAPRVSPSPPSRRTPSPEPTRSYDSSRGYGYGRDRDDDREQRGYRGDGDRDRGSYRGDGDRDRGSYRGDGDRDRGGYRGGDRDRGGPKPARIFVGNLPKGPDAPPDSELKEIFARYGPVVSVSVKDGFAFVEFENEDDMEKAIEGENGESIRGFSMRVQVSHAARGDGGRKAPGEGKCFNCQGFGHWARECPNPRQSYGGGGGGGGRSYEDRGRRGGDSYRRDSYGNDNNNSYERSDHGPTRRGRDDRGSSGPYSYNSPSRRSP